MKKITIDHNLTVLTSESFTQYLRAISKFKPLTIEEEKALTDDILNKVPSAINKLINHNLRFVVTVAKKYVSKDLLIEDLVNEGNIGLINAANKFDPHKGWKFISYAVWWIQKSILEYINKNSSMISMPLNKRNDVSKLEKLVQELEQKFGYSIDVQHVIDKYGQETEHGNKYAMLNELMNTNTSSLDIKISNSEDSDTMADLLMDYDSNTESLLNLPEKQQKVAKLLTCLKPRDRNIVMDAFGFNGLEKSNEMLAEDYQLSTEMVRQIKIKAIKKIKLRLADKEYADFC